MLGFHAISEAPISALAIAEGGSVTEAESSYTTAKPVLGFITAAYSLGSSITGAKGTAATITTARASSSSITTAKPTISTITA